MRKLPIVYHPDYNIKVGGVELVHSFDTQKYGKVYNQLCQDFNLTEENFHIVQNPISDEELLRIHTLEYLESLKNSSVIASIVEIGAVKLIPNRILQNKLLHPVRLATAGSLLATEIASKKKFAINLSGGYHHAKRNSGEGFCIFADIPLMIQKIWGKFPNHRVLVIDLDAHQGNGISTFMQKSENYALFDMYNYAIYPYDDFAKQFIQYDFPVEEKNSGEEYLEILKRELPKAIEEFRPDFLIYNAGTDVFKEDQLGQLQLSENEIVMRDEFVTEQGFKNNISTVMLLSGGYTSKSWQIISQSIHNILTKFSIIQS